jgi:hypothetical protein
MHAQTDQNQRAADLSPAKPGKRGPRGRSALRRNPQHPLPARRACRPPRRPRHVGHPCKRPFGDARLACKLPCIPHPRCRQNRRIRHAKPSDRLCARLDRGAGHQSAARLIARRGLRDGGVAGATLLLSASQRRHATTEVPGPTRYLSGQQPRLRMPHAHPSPRGSTDTPCLWPLFAFEPLAANTYTSWSAQFRKRSVPHPVTITGCVIFLCVGNMMR